MKKFIYQIPIYRDGKVTRLETVSGYIIKKYTNGLCFACHKIAPRKYSIEEYTTGLQIAITSSFQKADTTIENMIKERFENESNFLKACNYAVSNNKQYNSITA